MNSESKRGMYDMLFLLKTCVLTVVFIEILVYHFRVDTTLVCMCFRPSVGGFGAPVQRVPRGAAGPSTCLGQTALTAPLER